MFSPVRCKRTIAVIVIAVLILAGFVGYGIAEPQTSAGHTVFRVCYSFPPTRATYLKWLTGSLRDWNGSYVPTTIDEFLVDRLLTSKQSKERNAIIDFEVRQSSARWGMAMFSSPFSTDESAKGEVLEYLIRNLDSYQGEDAASAMVLIEALRRNEPLPKHDISGVHYWDKEGEQYVWPPERRAEAIKLFRAWWGDGRRWPNNKSQDPLAGSQFEIYSWAG